ncbi:succinyldiaminopimelate aminotransferase apoenzyme [Sanguibacter gelidistatuariae]|uniref:Aminotransferase n=1 Tax=Sanguibacter gelidistatuariae TaxID=1814289 RepID=A0A1G6MGH1_9MICO|nr:succinyldiaminopimelate transaminase [Sanguibacter gelidistatuariae]SDC54055.1 succinyldiaminopimelate aminotransferase apoenzyme [Sanguibacter gelidistatuariae]
MGFADLSDLVFPWDTLVPAARRARSHPDGIVDLSVGTPVDPTPEIIQRALAGAGDSHGYPTTHGTTALREAVAGWFDRRRGVPGLDPAAVLPTIGSKELVGLLPSLLSLGPGDTVVHPAIAYPTYDVGARLAGATPLPATRVGDWADRPDVKLVWVNSPANPTGAVLSIDELTEIVAAARKIGAIVVSDECYAELAWDESWVSSGVPSILDPRVNGGSHEGLLAAYSLSKQSNLAGYRAAFVAGDGALVGRLLELRKHLGMIVPAPVQAAMTVALTDDAHVAAQREIYRRRREIMLAALHGAGMVVDHSQAGLYLWTRPAELAAASAADSAADPAERPGAWATVESFAERGILVAPGTFYGAAGAGHVRVALTATDERIEAAAARLAET